jgi:hypothetical protein
MKIALDTETELIRPGLAAPPMSCTSWADEGLQAGLWHVRDSKPHWSRYLADPDCHLYGLNMAYDTGVASAQWSDMFVPVCEAYLDHRVHDVGIDQRLIDIANGELDGRWEANPNFDESQPISRTNKPERWRKNKYALAELALRLWGEWMNKGEDTWRLRYGSLIPVYPAAAWPADAQHYAIKDAVNTMRAHLFQLSQTGHWFQDQGYSVADVLRNSGAQAQTAFALHLMSCRGIRTDAAACKALIIAAEAEIDRCRDLCAQQGLINFTKRGVAKKSLDAARCYMLGALLREAGLPDDDDWQGWLVEQIDTYPGEVPKDRHILIEHEDDEGLAEIKVKLTKGGEISLDAEACKDVNDPVLRAYATFTSATTLRSKAARMAKGAHIPLQTRYRSPMDTGRTSSSKSDSPLVGDNFQNFRRNAMENELGEELPGQRECIKAREGFDICSVDGDNAEMRADAQDSIWTVGYSKLAEVLNAGQSAHLALAAAHLLKTPISYEEAYKLKKAGDPEVENATQFAKVPNFALAGGARALTMKPYAKGMKIILTDAQCFDLFDAFHSQWTEVKIKHGKVRKRLRAGRNVGGHIYEHPISGRLRRIERYTVGCNNPFQGLTADGMTSGLLWLALECYSGREYALQGDRIRPTGRRSPLEGSYPILFAHDETLVELRQWQYQHEAAYRQRDIMVQSYNRYTPDVKLTAEPCLMSRWYKKAGAVFDERKRLIRWEPKSKQVVLETAKSLVA